MAIAGACAVLVVCWALLFEFWATLVQLSMRLPLNDPLFPWLSSQWLVEGTAALSFLGTVSALISQWRKGEGRGISWWAPWWVWMLWACVSVWYSIDRGVSFRSATAFLSYGLLAAVLCACVERPGQLVTWVRFLVGVAVAVSLLGIAQYVWTFQGTLALVRHLQSTGELTVSGWWGGAFEDFMVRKRIFSVFGWPSLFAGFLLLTIPLGVSLCVMQPNGPKRLGYGAASGLLILCLVLTLSLGSWLAVMVTTGIIWWLRTCARAQTRGTSAGGTPPLRRVAVSAGAVCLLIGVASFMLAQRGRLFVAGSMSSRLAYIEGAARLLSLRPLTGTGLGTFGIAYRSVTPLERIEGQHAALHAHGTLLEFGAELGIVGLVCLAGFLWSVGRVIVTSLQDRSESPVRVLRQGLAVGVLGFFIHSLWEQTFVDPMLAPLWWMLVGLLTAEGSAQERVQRPGANRAHWIRIAAPCVGACVGLLAVARFACGDVWLARAALTARSSRPTEASRAFAWAQRWDASASRYPLEYGEYLVRLRQGDAEPTLRETATREAQRQFRRAIALSPWQALPWARFGLASWQLGQAAEGIQATEQAVRRNPNSRPALIQLGEMLRASGQYTRLLDVARTLETLEPTRYKGWFFEALAWEGLEDATAAEEAYRRVLALVPAHGPSLLRLAQLAERAGRRQEAAALYRRFLTAAPEAPEASQAVARRFLEATEPQPAKSP